MKEANGENFKEQILNDAIEDMIQEEILKNKKYIELVRKSIKIFNELVNSEHKDELMIEYEGIQSQLQEMLILEAFKQGQQANIVTTV